METSLTNVTQSQYETAVAVGRGVLVGGTAVAVGGSGVAVGGTEVCVGAFCVMATIVCVTIAWTVANESTCAGWCGLTSGRAKMVTGKHAMAAKKMTPKMIRIELVVSFIAHLQFVQEVDDDPAAKVLAPFRNSTGEPCPDKKFRSLSTSEFGFHLFPNHMRESRLSLRMNW